MEKSETATVQEEPVRGKLLTTTQAAKYIGAGKTWVYARLASGTLPFPHFRFKYGIRFDTADLNDYMRMCKSMKGGVMKR